MGRGPISAGQSVVRSGDVGILPIALGSNRGTMPRKGKRSKGDHDGIFPCFIEKLRSRTSSHPMVCFSQIQHNVQRITPIAAARAPQGNGGGLSGRTHLVAGVRVLLAKYGERATAGR